MKPISRITQSFGVNITSLVNGLGGEEGTTHSVCSGNMTQTQCFAGFDDIDHGLVVFRKNQR
eukprot:4770726-Prorocentrum_lima.AAC.1